MNQQEQTCIECDGEVDKYFEAYGCRCEYCYIKANPHINIGIGRNCDICNNELQKYRWCKIYGTNGGEYCKECFNKK